MTVNLVKSLYLGTELTEDELQDIPNYRGELHFHVMYKNAQFGAISGLLVFGPLVRIIRGPRTLSAIIQTAFKASKIGMAVGIPLAPIATEFFIRNATEERIYDRSYRIRNNKGQMRTDRYATCGGLLGGAASSAMGYNPMSGLILGIVSGCFTAGFIVNPRNKMKTS